MFQFQKGMLAPMNIMGCASLRFVSEMGAMFLFFVDSFRLIFSSFGQIPKAVRQIFFIGVKSISVIALIGLFTGMVIGLQTYYALSKFGSEGFLGAAVALSLVRELAPVLTAFMVTARAGSSMTAAIGVMRITEQVDALEIMDINPISYLVSPKLAACIISFPVLTTLFDLIGMSGGYLTGVSLMGGNAGAYIYSIDSSLNWEDISGGYIKSLVFAVIVCTVCCYHGYFTHLREDKGPEGVSQATTTAVVMACVLILVVDYMLTSILY